MDGNLGPQDELLSAIAMCDRAFEEVTLPKSNAGRLELLRRLEELSSAMATARIRLGVALVIIRVPTYPSGVGTTPMASEAVDRLLLALNNVIALRDT
jgi:hypothetical protein